MSKVVARTYTAAGFLNLLSISPKGIEALKKVSLRRGATIGTSEGDITSSMATILRKKGLAIPAKWNDSGRAITLKITPQGRKFLNFVRDIQAGDSITLYEVPKGTSLPRISRRR